MIVGIGTDMVEVARMAALLERRGEQAGRRILADSEWPAFQQSADPARFLAKRFAVKEALSKALGTGVREPVLLRSIAVAHDELGKPRLVLADELQRYCLQRGVAQMHVSISDERQYALAFVVLEGAL